MKKQKMIDRMRAGLDEACTMISGDPETMKLQAVRFMENYRIMRSIELQFDEENQT